MHITGSATIAGVIGNPIHHSKSPTIHNYWIQDLGINGVYVPFHILPEDFSTVIRMLPKIGIKGFNITLPYKEAILPFIDTVSEEAKKIGAVNTVKINEEGKLFGYNTDGEGYIEHLRRSIPSISFKNAKVLLVGAGGATRAIAYALHQANVASIAITNRTLEKAQQLMQDIAPSIEVVPWEKRNDMLEGINLLINTSSLGMVGFPSLDLNIDALPSDAIVSDIVYKPRFTELLKKAEARGLKIAEGLGMLLYQAVPGFEMWFGVRPEVTSDLTKLVMALSHE